ncbi:tetratricopeptide repeat protein, partial [Bacteroides acidifaciens]
MVRIIIALLFCFPVTICAQTYQQLSEKAIECIENDSLSQAEELLIKALKLEPKNGKNALLFSNLGLVQRRLGKFDKALESYSFALNFAPLAVPILLDRAAIYMEMGKIDRAYTDYCQVLDEDKQNKEALLMRAYIYVIRRDYPAARIDYNRLLEIEPQSYSGRLGLATLEQKEGKFREALEILNKMLATTPEDATLYIARADVEREMKHEDLALVDLEEAIRLDAASADAYLLRGN